MNPFWEKGEPIERNFEPILKLYQNWLSFTNKNNTNPDGKSEFVLFFTRDYFGVKISLN